MTFALVEDSAATTQDSSSWAPPEVGADTAPDERALGSRLSIAGMILAAALSSFTPGVMIQLANSTRRRRDPMGVGSDTTAVDSDQELYREVVELFEQVAASEVFHDGVHSTFSRALLALVAREGRAGLQAIAEFIFSRRANYDVVSEALRWLADVRNPDTLPQLWAILQRTLRSRSPRIRDGAILGFSALDDPQAQQLLTEARAVEQIAELRQLIDAVLEQLKSSTYASVTSNGPTKSLV